jgi:hypothetical protein
MIMINQRAFHVCIKPDSGEKIKEWAGHIQTEETDHLSITRDVHAELAWSFTNIIDSGLFQVLSHLYSCIRFVYQIRVSDTRKRFVYEGTSFVRASRVP